MLTRKQIELLEFIQKRVARDGVPPSFDEMKLALDLRSKSGIHRLVTALEERGFIRRLPHRARALEIIRLPDVLIRDDDVAAGDGGGGWLSAPGDLERPSGTGTASPRGHADHGQPCGGTAGDGPYRGGCPDRGDF